MRLLVITNDYPPKPGGIQMYLRNLVDAYPDPVHVFAPSDPGAEAGEEGVTRGARAWMLSAGGSATSWIDSDPMRCCSVLHTHSPHSGPGFGRSSTSRSVS